MTNEDSVSPLSYWNVPEILRTLKREADMFELDTPRIEQMHEQRCQPGFQSKTRTASGRFVDFGTKLYQLQLELSYKDNEIAILKKKLKNRTDELFPNGNVNKKSIVTTLRDKCETVERKLQIKNQELKFEQNRSASLSKQLGKVKKENNILRKEKRSNDKAVQTVPTTAKAVQAKPSIPATKTRNIMTQCSYVSYHPTTSSTARMSFDQTNKANSTVALEMTCGGRGQPHPTMQRAQVSVQQPTITQRNWGRSGSMERPQIRHSEQPHEVVDFPMEYVPNHVTPVTSTPSRDDTPHYVTELNINDESNGGDKEPLQMTFSQEFNEGAVKTLVKSNRNFAISETPYTNQSPAITPVEKRSTADSGVFSDGFSPDQSRRGITPYPPGSSPGYSSVLGGYNQSPHTASERAFERSLPYYMSNPLLKPDTGSSFSRASVKPRNPAAQSFHENFIPTSPRNIFYPGTGKEDHQSQKIPYYLFRREPGTEVVKRTTKPIYVHTSEISLTH